MADTNGMAGVPQSDQPRTSVPVALEDYFKPHANNRRGRPPIARRAGNRQQRRRDASHQYYRGDGSSRSRQQTPVPVPVAEQFESNIIVPFAIPVARGLLDHPRDEFRPIGGFRDARHKNSDISYFHWIPQVSKWICLGTLNLQGTSYLQDVTVHLKKDFERGMIDWAFFQKEVVRYVNLLAGKPESRGVYPLTAYLPQRPTTPVTLAFDAYCSDPAAREANIRHAAEGAAVNAATNANKMQTPERTQSHILGSLYSGGPFNQLSGSFSRINFNTSSGPEPLTPKPAATNQNAFDSNSAFSANSLDADNRVSDVSYTQSGCQEAFANGQLAVSKTQRAFPGQPGGNHAFQTCRNLPLGTPQEFGVQAHSSLDADDSVPHTTIPNFENLNPSFGAFQDTNNIRRSVLHDPLASPTPYIGGPATAQFNLFAAETARFPPPGLPGPITLQGKSSALMNGNAGYQLPNANQDTLSSRTKNANTLQQSRLSNDELREFYPLQPNHDRMTTFPDLSAVLDSRDTGDKTVDKEPNAFASQEPRAPTAEERLDQFWESGVQNRAKQEDYIARSLAASKLSGVAEAETAMHLFVRLHDQLEPYVNASNTRAANGPQEDYFLSKFVDPPDWCVNRGSTVASGGWGATDRKMWEESLFGEKDWGNAPQRIGRDPRYAPVRLYSHSRTHHPNVAMPVSMTPGAGSRGGARNVQGMNHRSGSHKSTPVPPMGRFS